MITGQIAIRTRELVRMICQSNEVDILAGHVGSDHIHLLVSVPPHLSTSKLVQYIKGNTSRKLQMEYKELNKQFWGQHLWARGYFVAKCLQGFTASVETGRGDAKYPMGIYKSYEKYASQQKMTLEQLVEEYYPFRELLSRIEQKMERFKGAETNFQIGMAAIDWCIENHMVQQGYTALEETLKTFLCEKIDAPQEEEFWRESVVKRLCTSLYDVIGKDRTEMNERYEAWKAFLQSLEEEQVEEGLGKGERLFELITGSEAHRDLIMLMNRIGDKRNDISHFGFTKHRASVEKLKEELETLTEDFRKIQEKWDA